MSWKSDGKLWPAHTPFFRRYFVNEKEREAQETRALCERVGRAWPVASVRQEIVDDIEVHVNFYIEQNDRDVAPEFRAILSAFLEDLIACDPVMGPMPELRDVMSLKELTELRSNLFAREHFLANRGSYEEKVKETLFDMLTGMIEEVQFTYDENALLQVQLALFIHEGNFASRSGRA